MKYLAEGDAELNAMRLAWSRPRRRLPIKSMTSVNLARAKMGLPVPVTSRHTLLLGPPGTGKTSSQVHQAAVWVDKGASRWWWVIAAIAVGLRLRPTPQKNTEEMLEAGAAVRSFLTRCTPA